MCVEKFNLRTRRGGLADTRLRSTTPRPFPKTRVSSNVAHIWHDSTIKWIDK